MSETIKSETNCPTCGCEVDIQGETTHFYVPKKRYSEEDMISFAHSYMAERRDRGARALTPELLIKKFKKL